MTQKRPAPVLRRLGAIAYDSLCIFGLLLAATQIAMIFHHFKAFDGEWWFQAYLLAVIVFYFAWFWSQYGQTIGMRAWNLIILTDQHQPLGFWQACYRCLCGALGFFSLGIGLWWGLWDRQGKTLYDRLTSTQVLSNSPEHP